MIVWRQARATFVLTAAMLAVFVLALAGCVVSAGDASGTLAKMGAIIPGTLSGPHLWRLVASLFLHVGVLHLLLNLWGLVQLGWVWETLLGSTRFVIAFFATGIVSSVVSALFVEPPGSVGASGAIFGLVTGLIVLLIRGQRWRTAPWARRLAWQLSVWAALSIGLGFLSPQVDNAAHVGGALGGIVVGWVMSSRRADRSGSLART